MTQASDPQTDLDALIEPVAWRYRHPLNSNLWIVVEGKDWPERDPAMEPLYPASALSRLREVEKERDEARTLVTEANNSLFGSQGYFHSLNGGPFDKYHLSKAIEDLKGEARAKYRAEAEVARLTERLAEAREALRPFADAVFNDNGDMSVNLSFPTYDDFCNAYFAGRRARAALEAKP